MLFVAAILLCDICIFVMLVLSCGFFKLSFNIGRNWISRCCYSITGIVLFLVATVDVLSRYKFVCRKVLAGCLAEFTSVTSVSHCPFPSVIIKLHVYC